MKQLFYLPILVVLLVANTPALAEDHEPLSQQAQQQIQQRTRDMSGAGVPEEAAQKMLRQMLQHRFQEENVERAQQIVMHNAEAGLGTEPLMNKAMEGMAKGVDEARILQAMERVQQRQTFSHQVARRLCEDPDAVAAMAEVVYDGLAADMQEMDVERIAARLAVRTRQQTRNDGEELALQTMQTVRTMARLGAHSTDVGEATCQALQLRYSARQMQQLGTRFADDAQHTPPGPLAQQYARALGSGEGLGSAHKYKYGRDDDNDGASGGQGSGSSSGSGGNGEGGGDGGSGHGGSSGANGGSGGSGSGGGSGNTGDGGGSGSGGSGSGGSGSGGSSDSGSGSSGSNGSSSGSGSGGSAGSGSGGSSSGSGSDSGSGSSGSSGSSSGSGSGSSSGSESGGSSGGSGSGSGSSSGSSGSGGGSSSAGSGGSSGSGSSGSSGGGSGSGSGGGK